MQNFWRSGPRARRVLAALVFAALVCAPALRATAQHEGHRTAAPPKPKAARSTRRPPARRPATRRAAPPRRAARRPAPSPRPSPARPAAQSQPPDPHAGHTPQPDPHSGHVQQATPTPTQVTTPTPTPAPTPDPHAGHSMPATQPTPQRPPSSQPTPRPSPGAQQQHEGHSMPAPQSQATVRRRASRAVLPEGPAVTLGELERVAAERNPTLAQAQSAVRAAEGRRRQAGAMPNPTVGYFAEDLSFRAPGETSQHGVFFEQTIPLGGKLAKSRRVFEREREQAESLAEAQRQRVLGSVRALYVETLGAERLLELRADLADLAREAVEITKELYNVGQADRPDQLEIEIEAERAEIELLRARTDWEQSWRALAAMTGRTDLRPARLAGRLEDAETALDEEQLLTTLLRDSPELRTARAGVERARAALTRERAERAPDLTLGGGVGYNREREESPAHGVAGRRRGYEARLEVGVSVPIFDRNRGGIAAAEAELAIAEREVERLQLALRSRLAASFRAYGGARQAAEKYRTQVVPRARAAYEMYLSNFRQMAASYPQVLIAQRTLFQVEVEYARTLVELRRASAALRGFLLEGGLDAVTRPGEGGERTEGFRLRSASDASGDSDDR